MGCGTQTPHDSFHGVRKRMGQNVIDIIQKLSVKFETLSAHELQYYILYYALIEITNLHFKTANIIFTF